MASGEFAVITGSIAGFIQPHRHMPDAGPDRHGVLRPGAHAPIGRDNKKADPAKVARDGY